MNKNQYLYVLRPIPRLQDEKSWTGRENEIVSRHFVALQEMLARGNLILAGRTLPLDSRTMGLVVFEAADDDEARRMMESDPAVIDGIMTAELFPYRVALLRNQ